MNTVSQFNPKRSLDQSCASNFGLRPSDFDLRPSAFGSRPSAFGLRPSAFALRSSDFARQRAAFTLIELMVVIGIVAIIIAAGVPAFVHAMRKEGMRKAVSDVVEGCSHARAQAILHGSPAELIIRADDGQMTVHPIAVRKDGSEGSATIAEPAPIAPGAGAFKGKLPDDIAVKLLYVNFKDQMEALEAHVRFFPNGTSDEFTIILSSTNAEQQISLDVITGLAEVKQIR